jgi:hypothetical protein
MRAQQNEVYLQGMQGRRHLQAQQAEVSMQGVWRLLFMPARQKKDNL